MDLSFLPAVNAGLNVIASGLLIWGLVLIKRKRIEAHRNVMLSAVGISVLFLVLYVVHKVWRATTEGELHTTFNAEGWLKGLYLTILFSHLILAMTVPFFAGFLVYLGLKDRRETHRRVARWGYPIWLYVSVTGVIIYVMLYPLNPAAG